MLHEEADEITTFPASETLENLFAGRDREGGCFFVVKRTKTQVVGASSFQFDEMPHHIQDLGPVLNLLNGIRGDHILPQVSR
jgi:hypothetical protein